MNTRSIRWRLPLSYAAIALLTALCLGAVLLATLRGYYGRSEEQRLFDNAAAIGVSVSTAIDSEASARLLGPMLEGIAFLSQTRVRYYDTTGSLVVDSGEQAAEGVYIVSASGGDSTLLTDATEEGNSSGGGALSEVVTIVFSESQESEPRILKTRIGGLGIGVSIPATSTTYGFRFGGDAGTLARSDTRVSVPVLGEAGDFVGTIEMSDAPAYGQAALQSVATYWALASIVAVLAAAGVGWLVSRRITAPLVVLTRSAASMAAGDLSSRAMVPRRDEFGELAAAFNDMAARVEETVAALRRFVADAAHELHTPLTALRTYLEVLSERGTGTDASVTRALEQVERLQGLTSGLMDLSRLEAATGAEGATTVDLVALVSGACERHAARAEQAGLSLQVDLPAGALTVRARAADVERALANLMDNAIKFGGSDGEIAVTLRRDGEWASLSVTDHGIGIPADELPLLFGRFRRARNASTYPGNGLGLAIVRAIAVEHGGRVEASSGGGTTTMTVRLPACPS